MEQISVPGLAILFGSIGYLLKVNNKKRNSIYSLSELLEEVMDYMEKSSSEEKRKYEYFVDSLAEKQNMKRQFQNHNNMEQKV